MPRAVEQQGLASRVVPLGQVGATLDDLLGQGPSGKAIYGLWTEPMIPEKWASQDEMDAELEGEIWRMFCADAPAQMAGIVEAWTARDVHRVVHLSHRLAGDSGAVGSVPVEVCGRALERAAGLPDAEPAGLTILVDALQQALKDALAER